MKTRICPRYEGSVIDSGYPTREVVKTASPEMLDLAPKDFPWKIGPSYNYQHHSQRGRQRIPTLMVNVALSCEIGVAFDRETGIERPVLPSTVAKNRACWAVREEKMPVGL